MKQWPLMKQQYETPLEVAQRHVAEVEARVEIQAAHVADIDRRKRNTAEARAVLSALKRVLRISREDLEVEKWQADAERGPQ